MQNEDKILEILTEMRKDFKTFDKRLGNLEKGQAKLVADVKVIKADVSYLKSASNEAFKDIDILDRRTAQFAKPVYRGGNQ